MGFWLVVVVVLVLLVARSRRLQARRSRQRSGEAPGMYPVYMDGPSGPVPAVGRPDARPARQRPPAPTEAVQEIEAIEAVQAVEAVQTIQPGAAVDAGQPAYAAGMQPTQAPYEGSTAISSSSLDTTLATRYQPSSLITSSTSSLSTTLADAPWEAPTVVFGPVSSIDLPTDLEKRVRLTLRDGTEVAAVQLVVDQLDVGLLEAAETVRRYVDNAPT